MKIDDDIKPTITVGTGVLIATLIWGIPGFAWSIGVILCTKR